MRADPRFLDKDLEFWAIVKYASEQGGYTNRKTKANPISTIKALSAKEIKLVMTNKEIDSRGVTEDRYALAAEYLAYRAKVLSEVVEPVLMNREQAKKCFDNVKARVKPTQPIPMNRQKGEKRHEAYLAAMV